MTDQMLKTLYAYITPTVPVVTGNSTTQLVVPTASGGLFTVGNQIIVRSPDYSIYSNPVDVQSVSGGVITAATPFVASGTPFTPASGYFVEGLGFNDGLGYYRYS
jgi:hypothetical protein